MLLQCVGLNSPNSPDKPVQNTAVDTVSTVSSLSTSSGVSSGSEPSSLLSTDASTTSGGVDSACNSLDGLSSLECNSAENSVSPVKRQIVGVNPASTTVNTVNESSRTTTTKQISTSTTKQVSTSTTKQANGSPWLVKPRTHRASTFSGFLSRPTVPRIDEHRCEDDEHINEISRKISECNSTCSSGYDSTSSSRKTSTSSFFGGASRKNSFASNSCSRKNSASSYQSGCYSRKSSTGSRKSSFLSFGSREPVLSPDDLLLSAAMSAAAQLANGNTPPTHTPGGVNNNNEVEGVKKTPASQEEMRLLKLMEDANRMIETDSKSLNSLSTQSAGSGHTATGHSRKSSDTSQISVQSGGSGGSSGGASSGPGGGSAPGPTQDPEEDLWGMWGRLVNDWENWNKKKSAQVKELVRKGIPVHFRGITWQLLCDAHISDDKSKYAEHLKTTSACEKVIRRDIARTYPEHDFFKEKDGLGQESLFNVMKAYSLHDREVGYCQGSAFIVGLLLMQMPEEEAFAVLVKLMQDYRLREMFKPSMAELGLCMYQLETLIQEHLPDLHAHFTSQSFHTSMYASSWFLTLFATSLPLGGACRVMDCFLVDGLEVIFRIALAVLTISKEELFAMDMEGMLKYFQKDLPVKFENDPESYFNMSYSIRYNAKKMKKMEKEYMAMKTKEQEELVELKRLRTENRLLRQKIDCLEAESSALADRLIQGQVSRAEEAEHNFAIKRELAALRQHDGETLEELNNARDKIRRLTGMIEENSCSRESSLAQLIIKEEELAQKEELVKCLQEELVGVRLKTAEAEAMNRDLQSRIQDLEEEQRRNREATPDHSVAHLQEELIAVRLREAEANLALKDLRHRVQDLTQLWTRHLHEQHSDKGDKATEAPSSSGGVKKLGSLLPSWDRSNSSDANKLEEELMTTKLHETACVAELKEQRLKVMELETAVQVSSNQIGRQEEENKRLQDSLESSQEEVRRLQSSLGEQRRKYGDLEAQIKEDKMMARIAEAEKSQNMAELTQRISSLESKNQELVTEGEVGRVGRDSEEVPTLQEKVEELQQEVERLQSLNNKLQKSPSNSSPNKPDYPGGSAGEDSDMEDPEELRLVISPNTMNGGVEFSDIPLSSPTPSPTNNNFITEAKQMSNGVKRERSASECSSDSTGATKADQRLNRRISHTLTEAFLEQLPEVQSNITKRETSA